MFQLFVVYLFLHFALESAPFWVAGTIYNEYAKIEADVEYVPTNASIVLENVNNINSMGRCASRCVLNELCLKVTYYDDLSICRLFAGDTSQGTTSGNANAKVITLINRIRSSTISSIVVASGTWNLTQNMTSARDFHKSTFIATTNSVLIVGGSDGSSPLSSTETFFSANGSFLRRGDTSAIRRFHTVDRLNDRDIVIAGGWYSIQSAELYDPLVGMSNATMLLSAPRAEHTSAAIDDGGNSTTKVLLVGGMDGTGVLDTGDVFYITTGVFTAVANNMTSARCYHTATALGNGYVLLAGGINNSSVSLDSLELYNSSSNLFVPLFIRMSTARSHHTATYIPSIQAVLFVGGRSQAIVLQTYDLFNVSTFTFAILNGSTLNARAFHTATLLLNEQVLIVGGQDTVRLYSCELYSPVTGTFTAVANMSIDRADHTSTLLANTGQVLVCGGENQNGTVLSSCELYQP